MKIEPMQDLSRNATVELLTRFFREEGFATPPDRIAANLNRMKSDDSCWVVLAIDDGGDPVGIATVTTMLYIEWGRLGEIGDLYVLPEYRNRRIAAALVEAAIAWSRKKGCSGIFVTITPVGETRHRLSAFYERLRFRATGRTIMTMDFAEL